MREVVIIRIESCFSAFTEVFKFLLNDIKDICNFPFISYLSETQSNSFQFLNKKFNDEHSCLILCINQLKMQPMKV